MGRAWCRAGAVVMLSVVLALAGAAPAFAGTAYSSWSYFTCGSYGYKNQATVTTDAYDARASTWLWSNPIAIRPAGWYGALARLYNDSGVLVKQAGYYYSSSEGNGVGIKTAGYTVHGSYYSYGITKSWTGSDYHGHATWTSPRQTY